jgi:tRNA 2-thiouridine synthesizing protein A
MREVAADLRERTLTYVQRHACFHAAWRRAGESEANTDIERPTCVFGPAVVTAAVPPANAPPAAAPSGDVSRDVPAMVWDAGAMGCGDLVLELRRRLTALPAGAVLELHADDPGAPIDLPAWCQLTRHTLLAAEHPIYRIRRRDR